MYETLNGYKYFRILIHFGNHNRVGLPPKSRYIPVILTFVWSWYLSCSLRSFVLRIIFFYWYLRSRRYSFVEKLCAMSVSVCIHVWFPNNCPSFKLMWYLFIYLFAFLPHKVNCMIPSYLVLVLLWRIGTN